MSTRANPEPGLVSSIAPWLSLQNGAGAVAFYEAAFGAVETHHVENSSGAVVSRLSINGSEFWLSGESPDETGIYAPESVADSPIRMILTVADPDSAFAQAVAAGASEVWPVSEGHGWRIGRVVDPFGHHWEIGRPLDTNEQ